MWLSFYNFKNMSDGKRAQGWLKIGKDIWAQLLYDMGIQMGQGQGYKNHDDFQVFEFYCSSYRVKGSSVV